MSAGEWKDLYYAIQKNDIGLVHYYVKQGVDINYQHPEIMTSLLIESIRQANYEIVKFLLENGADPSLGEDFGDDTPLSLAEKDKKILELVKTYIQKK
jgi:uncharacterized protein